MTEKKGGFIRVPTEKGSVQPDQSLIREIDQALDRLDSEEEKVVVQAPLPSSSEYYSRGTLRGVGAIKPGILTELAERMPRTPTEVITADQIKQAKASEPTGHEEPPYDSIEVLDPNK